MGVDEARTALVTGDPMKLIPLVRISFTMLGLVAITSTMQATEASLQEPVSMYSCPTNP